ncbi:hypothetical protein B0H11DRAFT_2262824 [Mycena galericulata]|nr:hypothetical protein B0H11DRAFT_2262824 [Mycena galericulata]
MSPRLDVLDDGEGGLVIGSDACSSSAGAPPLPLTNAIAPTPNLTRYPAVSPNRRRLTDALWAVGSAEDYDATTRDAADLALVWVRAWTLERNPGSGKGIRRESDPRTNLPMTTFSRARTLAHARLLEIGAPRAPSPTDRGKPAALLGRSSPYAFVAPVSAGIRDWKRICAFTFRLVHYVPVVAAILHLWNLETKINRSRNEDAVVRNMDTTTAHHLPHVGVPCSCYAFHFATHPHATVTYLFNCKVEFDNAYSTQWCEFES